MEKSDLKLVNLLNDSSFIRWIRGNANGKENMLWESWEKKSSYHSDLVNIANLLYSLPIEKVDVLDIDLQLERLNKKIEDEEDAKIFRLPVLPKKRNNGYFYMVVASVFLLLTTIGLLTLYYSEQSEDSPVQFLYSTFETGYGERGLIRISNGSLIRLNANSSLR